MTEEIDTAPEIVLGDDGDDGNEDWLSTATWDLPTTADALINLVGEELAFKLLVLPAGEAMPVALRHELEALQTGA